MSHGPFLIPVESDCQKGSCNILYCRSDLMHTLQRPSHNAPPLSQNFINPFSHRTFVISVLENHYSPKVFSESVHRAVTILLHYEQSDLPNQSPHQR